MVIRPAIARQRALWLLWTVMFVASLGAVVGAQPLDGGRARDDGRRS